MTHIVYTSIFGGKDKVEDFIWHEYPGDCVCFTDSEAKNSAINVIKSPALNKESAVSAKIFKFFPYFFFPDCDYSIYLDGNMRVKKGFNAQKLIDIYLVTNDLAIYAHPFRDCVYEELKGGLILKNKSYRAFRKQKKDYEKAGLPKHSGLAACGFLIRRHSLELKKFCEAWWKDFLNYTSRDQPSFGFTTWNLHYPYTIIPGSIMSNEYFSIVNHEK